MEAKPPSLSAGVPGQLLRLKWEMGLQLARPTQGPQTHRGLPPGSHLWGLGEGSPGQSLWPDPIQLVPHGLFLSCTPAIPPSHCDKVPPQQHVSGQPSLSGGRGLHTSFSPRLGSNPRRLESPLDFAKSDIGERNTGDQPSSSASFLGTY